MFLEESFSRLNNYSEQLLVNIGINSQSAHIINVFFLSLLVAILAIAANFLVKKIIIHVIKRWVDRSKNKYDDIFYEKGVFNKLSHLAPIIIISQLAPIPFNDFPEMIGFIITCTNIYMLVIVLMVLFGVINALHEIYNQTPMGKQRSIKGYVQAVKSILYFIAGLMLISIIFNKNLGSLFAGLTAFSAVLMLVFKDSILGLVAGIQISSNDLLRLGDYIEIPNKNIEGNVIDIKLSIVKVLNSNKSISTIPTYFFVSDTFMNWRGLDISEGRRLKRSVNLDIRSIKFCNEDLIEKIKEKKLLPEKVSIDALTTNAMLFRTHIEEYLRKSNLFVPGLTFIVRYLQPSENGLPLEIYCYSVEKDFSKFESIQSRIFEYVIAMAPTFEIAIYQRM
jgi:miniconductance mechanosensitive channel